jgi:hypothetical protein
MNPVMPFILPNVDGPAFDMPKALRTDARLSILPKAQERTCPGSHSDDLARSGSHPRRQPFNTPSIQRFKSATSADVMVCPAPA